MKCFRLYVITALLSIVYLCAYGQVNYNNNTLTTLSGYYPSALGSTNTANGKYAFVGGTNSFASGECSISFGSSAVVGVNGYGAVALGFFVESTTPSSFTLGRFLKSNASSAFVIGSGNGSNGYLINQTAGSLMVGFNSQYPTLFVSNSPGGSFTGKIGIGNIINPTAKLHLLSDDGEAAELKLEHRTTGLRQYSQIYLGTHTIRAGNAENMVFTTPTSKHFAFMTGNVGVGVSTPAQKLDVDGNIRIRNNGAIGSWSDNSLGLVTNSLVRLTVLNTGNIGVATTTPLQPLHVNGNVLLTGKNASLLFADEPPTNGNWGKWGIEYESGGLNFWKPYEGPASDDPKTNAYNYALFLRDDGNVGIGTCKPQAKFQVEGGSTLLNGNLQVGTSLAPKQSALFGNVGIGTSNPLATLHVNGCVSIGYNAYPLPGSNNLIVNGMVGIGTINPTAPLEVTGKIKASQIQLTSGVANGYILKCDESGNALWADPATIDDGDWVVNGNNISTNQYQLVGIRTSNPTEALDINGNIQCTGNLKGGRISWEPFKIFANSSETDGAYISLANKSSNAGSIKLYSTGVNGRIEFHNQNFQVMSIRGDNNIYMGNPETTTNLFVNGEINSNLVRVNTDEWWDCVFKDGYVLPKLSDVEAYIKEKGHLPDLPPESEVLQNGIDLGKMNALLLKKVEELTLYVIELEKKINK